MPVAAPEKRGARKEQKQPSLVLISGGLLLVRLRIFLLPTPAGFTVPLMIVLALPPSRQQAESHRRPGNGLHKPVAALDTVPPDIRLAVAVCDLLDRLAADFTPFHFRNHPAPVIAGNRAFFPSAL